MKFRKSPFREEPEINLVPFIDVLLVIVIFLAVTTTYAKYSELKINLPIASAENKINKIEEIVVGVSSSGDYLINGEIIGFSSVVSFAANLQRASRGNPDPTLIVNADGDATHQSVVNVMESARIAGFTKIVFSAQTE